MSRRSFGLLFLACFASVAFAQSPRERSSLADMKTDLFFLASPECEGRGPGTKGIDRAAEYIAKKFADAGVKPGGVEKGYFQPFSINGPPALEQPNSVVLEGPNRKATLELGKDFEVMGISGKGKIDAPVAFVGYGLQSKPYKYDDYDGIDVAGKVVILIRRLPRMGDKERTFVKDSDVKTLADLPSKLARAEANKAAAVILVNDASQAGTDDKLESFDYLSRAGFSKIPFIQVKREAIEPFLQAGLGMSLTDVQKAIEDDLKPRSKVLPEITAKIETNVVRTKIPVKNVIGVVEGSGPLANEIVVVGSHYDHLGFGDAGSLSGKQDKAIHHGADDNASGTTAMIELARRFAEKKDRKGRKLVFMAFSAEERGLLGSKFYCNDQPLFPLSDTAAMVNLDMVGRLTTDTKSNLSKLKVEGVGTAKSFDPLIDSLNKNVFQFQKGQAGKGPSDHSSFYDKKIPVLFFWTGLHSDYHKPSDTPEKINLEGMGKIVDYVESIVSNLASSPERPKYQETQGGMVASGAPKGPKLGISPSYGEDAKGLLIDAVTEGGAAAKAGMKAGDLIVEIGGKSVTNISTYMILMGEQATGREVEIGVIRDGKKLTLKATPQ